MTQPAAQHQTTRLCKTWPAHVLTMCSWFSLSQLCMQMPMLCLLSKAVCSLNSRYMAMHQYVDQYDLHTNMQCVDSHARSKGQDYRQKLLHEVLHVRLTVTYQCGILPAICPSMALKHVELLLCEVTEAWHNILPYWVRGGFLQHGTRQCNKIVSTHCSTSHVNALQVMSTLHSMFDLLVYSVCQRDTHIP